MVALAVLVGCSASSPVGSARFANAPVVWRVNDRAHVAKTPEGNEFLRSLYHFDGYMAAIERTLSLQRDRRALGVNAFDEVPDSTWFTNRIGVRNVAPAEILRGAGTGESPDKHLPWTITSAKNGGATLGFMVKDALGRKFILKFDAAPTPEVETGADAVTARLLWAAGYNTAEDHIVYFHLADVAIAPDATVEVHGKPQKLTKEYLQQELDAYAHANDGSIRGLASIFIHGKPLGGSTKVGVRKGDPNDRIPHELRRDQRGLRPFLIWLAHNDIKMDNTLDVYDADAKHPEIKYVTHYLIDFGDALGSQGLTLRKAYMDYEHWFDAKEQVLSLVTLGVHKQPWEGRIDPHLRGVGLFSADDFVPEKWKPAAMGWIPFFTADRIDDYWGAKIIMRFTRAQLAAAVAAGRYSDPRASSYLVDTLVTRARLLARDAFDKVSPIDEFELAHNRLCFTDLALHYGLASEPTTFTVQAYDEDGGELELHRTVTPDAEGRACVDKLMLVRDGARYTIFKIDNSRGMPGTVLHLAADPATKKPRMIGVYRL
ncbi:MAG TPA: hypothetical protein VGM90_35880 [Kofleriaceae bacterium]|jgi:hypothetical protein